MDLVSADPVVGAQYASLIFNDSLATDAAVDLRAALNHAAIIQNHGVAGGATAQGSVITSGSPRAPIIPICYHDLGGIIYWPNEGRSRKRCVFDNCHPFEEAMVWLTIVQPNGTRYQRVTTSSPCTCANSGPGWPTGANTQSGYAFARVPNGAATVLARTVYRCCQSGTATRTLACPPGPRSYRPCVPIAPTAPLDIQMGPWTPPGICGTVRNTNGMTTEVILATYESPCQLISWDYVTPEELTLTPNFSIRSCMPSTPWLYANSGTLWAEAPLPTSIPCGSFYPGNCLPGVVLNLQPAPCFSGRVTPWQPSMYRHYLVQFEGCYAGTCNGAARVLTTGVAADGTYNSQDILSPGSWLVTLRYIPNLQNPSHHVHVSSGYQHRLNVGERCHQHNFTLP